MGLETAKKWGLTYSLERMSPEADLKWDAIASFVRHLTHDLRNHLNGIELESTLLADSVTDPEGVESLTRIRRQLHEVAHGLRELSAKFVDPTPMASSIPAVELFMIFKEQADQIEKLPKIDWSHTLEEECVEVDAGGLAFAAKELLFNAGAFGIGERLKVAARAETGNVIYEFCEPKKEPVETERWGYSPFISKRHGGYGLGLWQTRKIVEASGGKIAHLYQPRTKQLFSTLSFPIIQPQTHN